MNAVHRFALGAVLAIGLGLCCLLLGMFVAGRCCVPPGSGLAGPGIVVGYGVLAGIAGAIAGGVLGFVLPPRRLAFAAALTGIAGGAVLVLLAITVVKGRAQTEAHLQEAYHRLPAFTLEIAVPADAPPARFERFVADWGNREAVVYGDERSAGCRASLSGPEAVALLGALREAEGVLYANPDVCAGFAESPLFTLAFFIPEALPPDTRGKVAPGPGCLARWPALATPMEEAERQQRGLRRRCAQ